MTETLPTSILASEGAPRATNATVPIQRVQVVSAKRPVAAHQCLGTDGVHPPGDGGSHEKKISSRRTLTAAGGLCPAQDDENHSRQCRQYAKPDTRRVPFLTCHDGQYQSPHRHRRKEQGRVSGEGAINSDDEEILVDEIAQETQKYDWDQIFSLGEWYRAAHSQ